MDMIYSIEYDDLMKYMMDVNGVYKVYRYLKVYEYTTNSSLTLVH